jgi:hypothetical protein
LEKEVCREVRIARAEKRAEMGDDVKDLVTTLISSTSPSSFGGSKVAALVDNIRTLFGNRILRRTGSSLDLLGRPILGNLKGVAIILAFVQLKEWEYAIVADLSQQDLKDAQTRSLIDNTVSNFGLASILQEDLIYEPMLHRSFTFPPDRDPTTPGWHKLSGMARSPLRLTETCKTSKKGVQPRFSWPRSSAGIIATIPTPDPESFTLRGG